MINFGTSLKNNQKYLKFILFILLLGFLIGFMIYKNIDNTSVIAELKNINEYLTNNKINYILIHFVIICILIISSITIVGLVLFPIYLVFESICITYNLLSFIELYKFNGLIYGLFYNLFSKALYLIILIIIFKKILSLLKDIISNFKDTNSIKTISFNNIKVFVIYIFIILGNDLLIYLFLNKILLNLIFIIK